MAIIHHDVLFPKRKPTLEDIKTKLEARTGLSMHCTREALDKETAHVWPHIGKVKESAAFECEEADDADFELTIGSDGVRVTWAAPGINHYLSAQVLASLKDLGGKWESPIDPIAHKKWSDLSRAEKHA